MIQEHNLLVVRELAQFALKALLTLNGGAIVVLLNFLGSIARDDVASSRVSFSFFEASAVAFLIGLFFCFATVALGYIMAYALSDPENELHKQGGAVLLLAQVMPAIGSFLFFVIGVLVALKGFN